MTWKASQLHDFKGKPMVPWHKWYSLRRRDIDICIYATDTTNHHCMYPQILHANTQDDHTNYWPITCHLLPHLLPPEAQIGERKETTRTHKKKYSQEAAGALSPPAPPSYSLEAWHHLLPKINCRNKAKSAWCSLLLSEEFQREWTDKLTLVHHITTLQEK